MFEMGLPSGPTECGTVEGAAGRSAEDPRDCDNVSGKAVSEEASEECSAFNLGKWMSNWNEP